jgi:hypothetical protein
MAIVAVFLILSCVASADRVREVLWQKPERAF